jgi:hypothetical protein
MEGRKDGRMGRRKEGMTEGRKEGWKKGRKSNSIDHISLRNCVLRVIDGKIEGRDTRKKTLAAILRKR